MVVDKAIIHNYNNDNDITNENNKGNNKENKNESNDYYCDSIKTHLVPRNKLEKLLLKGIHSNNNDNNYNDNSNNNNNNDNSAGDGIVLQLGGNDALSMCAASRIAVNEFGYNAININCGCPR